MRTYANFSLLQKTKMLLYFALILVEITISVWIITHGFGHEQIENFRKLKDILPKGHIYSVFICQLVVKALDLTVAILATTLRYSEYMK